MLGAWRRRGVLRLTPRWFVALLPSAVKQNRVSARARLVSRRVGAGSRSSREELLPAGNTGENQRPGFGGDGARCLARPRLHLGAVTGPGAGAASAEGSSALGSGRRGVGVSRELVLVDNRGLRGMGWELSLP